MTIPKLKNVPCRTDHGGCGEILAQTDGEYLIVKGLIVNPEDSVQQIVCLCKKKTIWRCEQQYLPKKRRK